MWMVFYDFSEAFCPLPKTVKAGLEALKSCFSVVMDYFLGLEMRGRGTGGHVLQHILLTPNQQESAELKRRPKIDGLLSAGLPRTGSRSDVGWTCQDLNLSCFLKIFWPTKAQILLKTSPGQISNEMSSALTPLDPT